MNALLSLLVSAAVTAGPVGPTVSPKPRGQDISVQVDLSALPKTANPRIEGWIVEDARKTLEVAGHRVVSQGAHSIKVSVSWFGRDNLDTLVVVQLDDGDPAEIKCLGCDEEEWLPMLRTEIAVLVEPFDHPEEVTPPIPPDDETEPDDGTEPPDKLPVAVEEKTDKEKRFGSLGATGMGLSLVGGVGVGVGIGLALRTPSLAGAGSTTRDVLDTRTAGYVAMGIGGAVLVTGVTMLVVDVVRRKRSRNASLLPTPRGVVLIGRF